MTELGQNGQNPEHSQKWPLATGISPKIYHCLCKLSWKTDECGAHPQKGSYMVSYLIVLNEMHVDNNKAPNEIAKTTLGHPDD